ncbi:hypothetical protein FCULG_00012789 [Fusarium culmorum]|uniref:Uncharacterized protein n=1 Tax=Fusarium culmorum TaxID=5516 RepID=A0A2T4GEU7_FUSCU|nr:hypothetical protein FCULG_00012958 [Fusarium culmorum]PTD03441.1 hypothetical protein FCULG_00012789 [Fusarium culmorum]
MVIEITETQERELPFLQDATAGRNATADVAFTATENGSTQKRRAHALDHLDSSGRAHKKRRPSKGDRPQEDELPRETVVNLLNSISKLTGGKYAVIEDRLVRRSGDASWQQQIAGWKKKHVSSVFVPLWGDDNRMALGILDVNSYRIVLHIRGQYPPPTIDSQNVLTWLELHGGPWRVPPVYSCLPWTEESSGSVNPMMQAFLTASKVGSDQWLDPESCDFFMRAVDAAETNGELPTDTHVTCRVTAASTLDDLTDSLTKMIDDLGKRALAGDMVGRIVKGLSSYDMEDGAKKRRCLKNAEVHCQKQAEGASLQLEKVFGALDPIIDGKTVQAPAFHDARQMFVLNQKGSKDNKGEKKRKKLERI